MTSRIVAIALLCGSFLVMHVPVARGQGLEPTFGELIAGNIGDAINAAQTARANMDAFNRNIVAARQRYRECGGICADRNQVATELDDLLTSKDFHYAFMRFLGRGLAGIGGSVQMEFTQMVLGDSGEGMPSYASATFNLWTRCLDRGKNLGLFIDLPGPEAFQACQDIFLAHRERRNLWEFFERPGVRQSLLAEGAPAVGALILTEQPETADSNLLPADIGSPEILKCEYGPIGSDTDSVVQRFDFWYGQVPVSRVELLQSLRWSGPWRTAPSFRIKYLRMPEIARTTCPPGDLNALALYMNQTDSEEFLAIVQQRQRQKQQYEAEDQRRIAEDAQRRRAEDVEYTRQVNADATKLTEAHADAQIECRQLYNLNDPRWRECNEAAQTQVNYLYSDLKNRTENSPMMRHTSNTIAGIGTRQGTIDACQKTSDENTRGTISNMVTRVYPDSVPKLMERYDIRYEESFIWPTGVESCTDRRMAEFKAGIEMAFREIREDIFSINVRGGRITRESAEVLTHDEIADWLAITTAYEAVEKMQPTFFHGDLGARMRMNPNDRTMYECVSNPPCPGIVLYVDGLRAPRLEELHGIQAAEIQKIEYVKGADATGIYGEDHHQGAILVTTVGAEPQRENIGSEPEDRTGWSGPYTRQEAQVMSEIWESIRGAARYEDVNWSVLNMTSAPGSAEAQQNTSIHWETLRGAGKFSDIDWEASAGYSQTSNSPPENLAQPSPPP